MQPKQAHILIVEDDAAHAELIKRAFLGSRVQYPLRFEESLDAARESKQQSMPSIIITDLRLPDGRGTELIEPVENPDACPVVIMTSFGNEESAVEAMRTGAIDYIVKGPQTFMTLPRTAERAMREWQLRRERYQTKVQLARSEERYRHIIHTLTDTIYTLIIEGQRVTEIENFSNGEDLTGYTRSELGEKPANWLRVVHPEDRRNFIQTLNRVITHRQSDIIEHRIMRKDGSLRWIRNAMVVHTDLNENLIACDGIVSDITDQKTADIKQRRLAAALEQAAEGIYITDHRGVIEYANQTFSRMTLYPLDEIIGRNINILKSHQHQDEFYREIWQTIKAGNTWSGTFTNRRKDDRLYKAETTITPVIENDIFQTPKYVAVARDVTRESYVETQLRQAQKLHAIGTLAGGIAHDFNNILYAVIGYTELASQKIPAESPTQPYLKEVLTAGNRAAQLIGQILAFSRQNDQERIPGKLQPILKEALKLLRGTIPTTVELNQEIYPDVGPVMSDPTQIHQILMNLCTNAYHALLNHTGRITIRYEQIHMTPEEAHRNLDIDPGTYAQLSIIDNGHGMNTETLERAFDPFFTTKSVGEGTGMGLSTVHGIVKTHNGAIQIESAINRGTNVTIHLPICEETIDDSDDLSVLTPEEQRGNILFVDDETHITRMVPEMLASYGYHTDAYSDSAQALQAFQNDPERWDILITDQTMPEITGLELARQALQLRPDIIVILCTGFSETVNEDIAHQNGIHEYLKKPLLSKDLANAIHRARSNAQTTANTT
jgi:PAS domain S-box-containing protein